MTDKETQEQQREILRPGGDTNTPVGDVKKTSVTISGAEGGKSEFINGNFEISSSNEKALSKNDGHYVYNFTGADGSSNSKIVFFKNKWYIITGSVLDDTMLSTGNLNTLHAVVECPSDKLGCELKDCVSQSWQEYEDEGGKATAKVSKIKMAVNTSDFSDIPSKDLTSADPQTQIHEDIPDLELMKSICASAAEAYDKITVQFKAIVYTDPASISSFDKELEKTITGLKAAQASLDAYKKAKAIPVSGTPSGGGSSSSSSSKKNRKSHKSYHPDIGKTRKHHYNADHKRVSFVHQA